MKRNARTAMNQLKKMGVPMLEEGCGSPNAHFSISGEMEDSYLWIDYYGEFRGGYPYINEDLEKVLSKHGLFAEWENAAIVSVYDI